MNIIYLYLGGCLIGGGIAGIMATMARGGAEKEKEGGIPENEKGAGYLLDRYDRPEKEEGEGVLSALLSSYRSLRDQKAAGFGPWLSTCIRKIQSGVYVPANVALLALRWTRDELAGRRYDLAGLDEAIAALEREI